ncbi:replication initiator protein [Mycobacteroides abscessus subsp. abscessus]|uniref:replication initiator n=1 Tax=Mycobacteroides abscessus TaxID=36809 RepID=UPI00092A6FF0|nr:replication initiator [Mycobacteroides abscessus]SHT15669.1 replication initiator protein [Mycobacteroides abscessus subsp. abscessus]SHU41183.1 replication initiator protein [Mycobacteroides abscessus subsp. abscessus]SHU45240.1 replication initiator protein [Mycobacteroides abscessus subsp. abscessus]SHX88671.1 replication initiator protein [Mycobacteroides abscessus subsp. abscessus]SIA94366.1 replication initiator protein [Mycobacteroides abscessus subsp. abscessus]
MTSTYGIRDGGGPAITLPGVPTTCDPQPVLAQMLRRASSLGFESWWQRAQSVGFCAAPIQLVGTDHYGREKIVWARCNNRRASVCPSCSDLYARDTWQLVHAGCAGGHHNMPTDVACRPQVFATLTAPSFGSVHNATGSTCRDHRRIGEFRRCPHGKPLWCNKKHNHDDKAAGQPLCTDCYDYGGHVLFTWHLPELWRRFTITLRRALAKKLKNQGTSPSSLRVSFVKVVEMQARAIPHIHALIRLDPATDTGDHDVHGPAATCGGGEKRHDTGPAWQPPITAAELAALVQHAASVVTLDVPNPRADNDIETSTVIVRFGAQIDTQPLSPECATEQDNSRESNAATGRLSPHRVAGYLAKYVTKSLQELGISARRLSGEAIADLDVTEHVRTILTTIDHLAKGARVLGIESLTGVGCWLHTLGYRGHITTKSRRYSTTLGTLRARRHQWTLKQIVRDGKASQANHADQITSAVHSDVCWQFDRAGHTSLGDRVLVLSAAHRHIETRRIGLSEYRRIRREGG